MSDLAVVFLGIIALATLTTAVIQVGVLIAAARLVKRLELLLNRAERELNPLFTEVNKIGRDVARATALAVAQVERVDTFMTNLTHRADDAVNRMQSKVSGPVHEGVALFRGFQAAINSLKESAARRPRHSGDGEDALFI